MLMAPGGFCRFATNCKIIDGGHEIQNAIDLVQTRDRRYPQSEKNVREVNILIQYCGAPGCTPTTTPPAAAGRVMAVAHENVRSSRTRRTANGSEKNGRLCWAGSPDGRTFNNRRVKRQVKH